MLTLFGKILTKKKFKIKNFLINNLNNALFLMSFNNKYLKGEIGR